MATVRGAVSSRNILPEWWHVLLLRDCGRASLSVSIHTVIRILNLWLICVQETISELISIMQYPNKEASKYI